LEQAMVHLEQNSVHFGIISIQKEVFIYQKEFIFDLRTTNSSFTKTKCLMSDVLMNHRNIIPKLEHLNLPLTVSIQQRIQTISTKQLSINMGRSANYLHKQLKNPDQPISMLIMLSTHLQYNFLEPYHSILHSGVPPTRAEKALQQQIADLQKELEAVKNERDIYKAVVMK
jgi:hypothetical protein